MDLGEPLPSGLHCCDYAHDSSLISAYLMYGNNSAGVGVEGVFFLVSFTCVQLLSVYCVVKMCTQHTA